MGKRSNFKKRERSFYPTPYPAVPPLLPYLNPVGEHFIEPCYGAGDLARHLWQNGHTCIEAYDIEPLSSDVSLANATEAKYPSADCFITNPPWDRIYLHAIIENLRNQLPTWLLFDADWMHTKQAAPYLPYCSMIVSVGRVKWIPDSKHTGKDNCCWYLFQKEEQETKFFGRNR